MRAFNLTRPLTRLSRIEALILDVPSLSFRSLHNNIGGGRQSHVMHFEGTSAALKALRQRYVADPPPYMESLEVLRQTRNALFLFSVERIGQHPSDIAIFIERHLGPGTVSTYHKSIAGVTWDIITVNERGLQPFLKAIADTEQHWTALTGDRLGPYRLTSPRTGRRLNQDASALSPLEEAVLRLALQRGFYETPKRCTMSDLADEMGLPTSTAHFRLQKAERIGLGAYLRQARGRVADS